MGKKSEEDEMENQWVVFLSLGFMFTTLGTLYSSMESMPILASLAIFGGAALFFLAAILSHKET